MDHFYDGIGGWSQGIHEFYEAVTPTLPPRPVCVEVGCYNGRSTAHLIVNIINRGDNGTVTAVDIWEGAEEMAKAAGFPAAKRADFDANMKPIRDAGHGDQLRVLEMPSVRAAELFADGSVDLVFIDADHSEEGIRSDVEAWWPKVKPGGVLSGHDFYEDYPGVMKVVREKFGYSVTIMGTCWMTRKQTTPAKITVETE